MPRVTGTVKFWNNVAGYGFIIPDDHTAEAFVHRTDIIKMELPILHMGQKVSYELVDSGNKKGTGKKATAVELVG